MDGKGHWMDNVMIERLWRSRKYEYIYLQAFETGSEARAGIGSWIEYYNIKRPHSALAGQTPAKAYRGRAAASPGHARRGCRCHWRHENQHGIPPSKRRQAVQRLGSTSTIRVDPSSTGVSRPRGALNKPG